MSQCAFFASAPTVRFLKTMERLGALPSAQRNSIATDVDAAIAPLIGGRDLDALLRYVQALQDERWRLIGSGVNDIADPCFARVAIVEHWLTAQIELLSPTAPVAEILAERKCRAIEDFLRETLSRPAVESVRQESSQVTTNLDRSAEQTANPRPLGPERARRRRGCFGADNRRRARPIRHAMETCRKP